MIDFNYKFLDMFGEPKIEQVGNKLQEMTLATIAINSLNVNEKELDEVEKVKRGRLCYKILDKMQSNDGVFDLEERALILKQIKKYYDPMTCAKVEEIFNAA